MDTIRIRKYQPEDFDEVKRLFNLSNRKFEIWFGIIKGVQTKQVYGKLIFQIFVISTLTSIYNGITAISIGACIHVICVVLFYVQCLW